MPVVDSNRSSRALDRLTFGLVVTAVGIVAAAGAATGVALAADVVSPHHAGEVKARPTRVGDVAPSAEEVARDLVGGTNATAAAMVGGTIANASCLEGSPGSYACSFVRIVPGRVRDCAVAILKWTPRGDSTYTVQTAGRVALAPEQCGPVKKVLHVLGTSGSS
jgi:hypothetical protein